MPRLNEVFMFGGYAMRSHSETRWAAMMDFLGIRWIYEPQVYRTRHGGYLPDFYLPDTGVFVEVKGAAPSEVEIDKGIDLERQTGCPVIFTYGRLRMDGLYLIDGTLAYYGGRNCMRFSIFEICKGIEQWRGLDDCVRFAMAGQIKLELEGVSISQILQELMDGWKGRSEVERHRAKEVAALNAQKFTGDTVPNLPTVCLLSFAGIAGRNRLATKAEEQAI